MKSLVAHFTGWLASVIFIAAATLLWGSAALVVFLTGNGSVTGRG